MILYHGTYTDFQNIDLNVCLPYKDFGRGFYLTDIPLQAERMAARKARLHKGTGVVIEYEFDEAHLHDGTLKVKQFAKPDREWAEFIYKNRSRHENFSHDYDIIVGPIADDGVAYLLDRYEEGFISLEELATELEFKELNKQYYFGTQLSLSYLKRL